MFQVYDKSHLLYLNVLLIFTMAYLCYVTQLVPVTLDMHFIWGAMAARLPDGGQWCPDSLKSPLDITHWQFDYNS